MANIIPINSELFDVNNLMNRHLKLISEKLNEQLELACKERGIELSDLQSGKYTIEKIFDSVNQKENYICPQICQEIPLITFEMAKFDEENFTYTQEITRPTYEK